MRIPRGSTVLERPQPRSLIPEPAFAPPSASGTTLASVPQTYPAGPTYESFLYSQLQNAGFPGVANTWTQPQTFQAQTSGAYAATFQTAAPSWTGVKTRFGTGNLGVAGAGWEVGLLDSQNSYDPNGNCLYWTDLKSNNTRLYLDSQGQLTVNGVAAAGFVNNNFRIQNTATTSATNGTGVGIAFELFDAGGFGAGSAINCQMTAVTSHAPTTEFDFYCLNAGTGNLCMAINGTGLVGIYGPTAQLIIPRAPSTNVNVGTLMLGNGGFAGGAGGYAGNLFGTDIAINESSGYQGRFIDCQVAGVTKFFVRYDGTVNIPGTLQHVGSAIGFFNTAPAARYNVTGAKGGNAALTSLIAAMVAYGLVQDSTS